MLVFRFSRLLGSFEITGVTSPGDRPRGSFRPPVDISYRDRSFTVRVDLPGVSPEDVCIEASENEVSIVGAVPPSDRPGPCRLMERPSGSFARTLSFPCCIAPDKINAVLVNGVLTLVIPSPDLDRDPTRIEVRIEGGD
jgi:HSP20 family protein